MATCKDQETKDDENESECFTDLLEIFRKINVYVEIVEKRLNELIKTPENNPMSLDDITLRDYQKIGYKWIMTLYENGMNGILADEMGLGKTIQVIAALAGLMEAGVAGPFLVVAPLSLLSVWADQLATFASRLPCMVYYGSLSERLSLRRRIRRRVCVNLSNADVGESCIRPHLSQNTSDESTLVTHTSASANESTVQFDHEAETMKASTDPSAQRLYLSTSFDSLLSFPSAKSLQTNVPLDLSVSSGRFSECNKMENNLQIEEQMHYYASEKSISNNLDDISNTELSSVRTPETEKKETNGIASTSIQSSEEKEGEFVHQLTDEKQGVHHGEIESKINKNVDFPSRKCSLQEALAHLEQVISDVILGHSYAKEEESIENINIVETVASSSASSRDALKMVENTVLLSCDETLSGYFLEDNQKHSHLTQQSILNSVTPKINENHSNHYYQYSENCRTGSLTFTSLNENESSQLPSEFGESIDNIINYSQERQTKEALTQLEPQNSQLKPFNSFEVEPPSSARLLKVVSDVIVSDKKSLPASSSSQLFYTDGNEKGVTENNKFPSVAISSVKHTARRISDPVALSHLDDIVDEVIANYIPPPAENILDDWRKKSHANKPSNQGIPVAKKQSSNKSDGTSPEGIFWTCPIVLTSYEIVLRDANYLRHVPFKAVIVDEGQRLKNPCSRLYKRLAKFHTGLRLLITGTPLQNRLSELWALLHFILPEIFTSLAMFEHWFDPVALSKQSGIDRLAAAELEQALITKLHRIIGPFLLRRTKAETRLLLPPKREILIRVGMTRLQQELYRQAADLCLSNHGPGEPGNRKARRCLALNRLLGHSTSDSLTRVDKANILPESQLRGRPPKNQKRLTRSARRRFLQSQEMATGDKPTVLCDFTSNQAPASRPRLRSQRGTLVPQDTRGGKVDDDNVSFPTEATAISQCNDASEEIDAVTPTSKTSIDFILSPQLSLHNGLMVLRRIVNHPYLAIERPEEAAPLRESADSQSDCEDPVSSEGQALIKASGKTLLLDRLLQELINTGHKVLIFSQMNIVLDVLEEVLDARGWPWVRLDGSTKLADRLIAIRRFNHETDLPVFLVSTRAGGCGLNLQTAADTVIIFDSDWNPQADLQAQDRCHRIGQTRPVLVLRLATGDTIDEVIVRRAQAKRGLERIVLSNRGLGRVESVAEAYLEHCSSGARDSNLGKTSSRLTGGASPVDCGAMQLDQDVSRIGISKTELLNLLSQSDFHQDLEGDLSDEQLKALLDRSDLYRLWQQETEDAAAPAAPAAQVSSSSCATGDQKADDACSVAAAARQQSSPRSRQASGSAADGSHRRRRQVSSSSSSSSSPSSSVCSSRCPRSKQAKRSRCSPVTTKRSPDQLISALSDPSVQLLWQPEP